MTALRLEFVAVDNLGHELPIEIGPVDDAPAVPRAYETVWLGGDRWTVVDVAYAMASLAPQAVVTLTVRRRS